MKRPSNTKRTPNRIASNSNILFNQEMNKTPGFANAMMNIIRENYGSSSNDTGRDFNLVGHIIHREQLEELEKIAL